MNVSCLAHMPPSASPGAMTWFIGIGPVKAPNHADKLVSPNISRAYTESISIGPEFANNWLHYFKLTIAVIILLVARVSPQASPPAAPHSP